MYQTGQGEVKHNRRKWEKTGKCAVDGERRKLKPSTSQELKVEFLRRLNHEFRPCFAFSCLLLG